VDKRNAEIERLLLELASFNKRTEELQKIASPKFDNRGFEGERPGAVATD
jgi:hypothetical protein